MSEVLKEVLKLNAADRLQIIEDIWDSLSADKIPLTDAQKKELDRRINLYEEGKMKTSSWEEVKARIKKSL